MKKNILSLFTIITIGIAFVACKSKTEKENTTNAETAMVTHNNAVKFAVDTEASTIVWKGFKPTGSHTGTINIESGEFNVDDSNITGGSFLINMSSLKESNSNARFEGHLKSADFFDVEKFPTAAFEITGVETKDGQTILSGNLKLKDKVNNVSFAVTITHEGDVLTLISETFTIDRSKWNVRYGSKSFFDDLGDKFINNDIELTITVKANNSI